MSRQIFKESGKWVIISAIAAASILSAIGFITYNNLRSSTQSAAPAPSPVATPKPQTVTAIGRLEPKDGVMKIAAPSSDSKRVMRLLVKEGARVKAGQTLAVMDNGDRLQAAVVEAAAGVQEAQQRLAQVQAGSKSGDIEAERANVGRLQAELQNAAREFARREQLYKDGAISASALDGYRLTLQTTERQLTEARRKLESVSEVRGVDVGLAQSQVEVAIAKLERAKTERDTAIVVAPISGSVIKVHADPGEEVGTDGILELGNTDQMYVVAEVYETDVNTVKMGQRAQITSSSFPQTLNGTVERVGMRVNRNDVLSVDPAADVDTRVVEVKIRLNNSKPVAGFTNLQVNVAIEE